MVCDATEIVHNPSYEQVLILILLEYGLRQVRKKFKLKVVVGLNPYSTGIWSATWQTVRLANLFCVLILILLEYGLRPKTVDALMKLELPS